MTGRGRLHNLRTNSPVYALGPSINGLVTYGNTKLCCRGFILALFQSTTVDKIDSEHTRDYKYAKLKYNELQ